VKSRALGPPSPLAAPPGLSAIAVDVGGQELVVLRVPSSTSTWQGLTQTEEAIAELALRGLSNKEIATLRGTSAHTVAVQLASIYKKLGLGSRAELAAATFGDARPRAETPR
jgi:DNA-binding CsgD family transcriptional regulator